MQRIFALLLWLAGLVSPAVVAAAPAGYRQFAETPSFRFFSLEEKGPPVALFQTLAANAERLFSPIANATGYVPDEKAEILLTYDLDEFVRLGFPQWAIGVAVPEKNLIAITLTDRNGRVVDPFPVFQHEASHLALLRAAGPERASQLPRWFIEGIATWQANESSRAWDQELLNAARTGHLSSIYEIEEQLPEDDTLIGRAYAQSAAFVRYLAQVRGPEALGRVVRRVADGEPFPVALRAELGDGVYEYDLSFRHELDQNASWITVIADPNLIWIIAAFGFFGIYLRRRREMQRAMEALALEEARAEARGFVHFPYWEMQPVADDLAAPAAARAAHPDDGPDSIDAQVIPLRPTGFVPVSTLRALRPLPKTTIEATSVARPLAPIVPFPAAPLALTEATTTGEKRGARGEGFGPAPLAPTEATTASRTEAPPAAAPTPPTGPRAVPAGPLRLVLPSLEAISSTLAEMPPAVEGSRTVPMPYTVVDTGGAPLPGRPSDEEP